MIYRIGFFVVVSAACLGSCATVEPEPVQAESKPRCVSSVWPSTTLPYEQLSQIRIRAEQGDASAQVALGQQGGEGAARWYRAAADQGNADGQFGLGRLYLLGLGVDQRASEAVKFFQLSAAQGNADAQNALGDLYDVGRGVDRNDAEAVRFYQLAADQCHLTARQNLAFAHLNGKGTAQDLAEAVRLYRLAGDPDGVERSINWSNQTADGQNINDRDIAQLSLGLMLSSGLGVSKDENRSRIWYRLAADQYLAIGPKSENIMRFHIAVTQGAPEEQFRIGEMYVNARSYTQDFHAEKIISVQSDADAEALRWYRLAADQGHAEAQFNIAAMTYKSRIRRVGDGLSWSEVEPFNWYKLSAEKGYLYAQNNLGWMYYSGIGTPSDASEAYRWFRIAAERGLAQAQLNLSKMYERGVGVAQNFDEARRWEQLARDQGSSPGRPDVYVIGWTE